MYSSHESRCWLYKYTSILSMFNLALNYVIKSQCEKDRNFAWEMNWKLRYLRVLAIQVSNTEWNTNINMFWVCFVFFFFFSSSFCLLLFFTSVELCITKADCQTLLTNRLTHVSTVPALNCSFIYKHFSYFSGHLISSLWWLISPPYMFSLFRCYCIVIKISIICIPWKLELNWKQKIPKAFIMYLNLSYAKQKAEM